MGPGANKNTLGERGGRGGDPVGPGPAKIKKKTTPRWQKNAVWAWWPRPPLGLGCAPGPAAAPGTATRPRPQSRVWDGADAHPVLRATPQTPWGGSDPKKPLRGQPGDSATEPCPRLRSPPGVGGWVPQRGARRQGPAPYPKKTIPIPIPGRQHLSTPRGAFLALQKRRREGRARSFPALRGTACTARPERALQTLTIFFYFFFFK